LAKAKSASLLSLSLELPLLLSGNDAHLARAHDVASHFAVAYQIIDDLADVAQDAQEGSSNLLLSLIERDRLTKSEAYTCAIELVTSRLASVESLARYLPNDCAATLLLYAEKLNRALAKYSAAPIALAGG
jgi:hypothetical protein